MIYAQALHVSLLALSFLPHLNAQYLLRADPPLPTAPPLFIRQLQTCASTATLCNDGSGGCCDIGAACTSSKGIPICAEACGPADSQCTGVMDGFCCQAGHTCNYVSTMCVSNGLGFSVAPTFAAVVTSTMPVEPTLSLQPVPSSTFTATVAIPTTPEDLPTSTSSTSSASSASSTTSTSSTDSESTSALSSDTQGTTSASKISSTSTTARPTQSIIPSGQDKLGLDMIVLLAGYGLAFLNPLGIVG